MISGCFRIVGTSMAAVWLAGCASTGTGIHSPVVNLTGVELTSASLSDQTFLLSFDVSNPNPFPLPVRAVEYRLALDDRHFAGGSTQGKFTVPANGASNFAITVELDLLRSTSHVTSLVRGGSPDDIGYELSGRLAVDIPLLPPVSFSSEGVVNLTRTASVFFE